MATLSVHKGDHKRRGESRRILWLAASSASHTDMLTGGRTGQHTPCQEEGSSKYDRPTLAACCGQELLGHTVHV